MATAFLFILCMVVAYLVGSICSAVIVCNLFDLPDPRMSGSKNPGATNVLRLAGKQYALVVLVGDMLKGLLPVLFAKLIGVGPITIAFTCLAAVLGHIYPVFFSFKGGKGVATAMGALLGFHFILGVVVIATWLLVANFSRYSSLASIIAILLAPFYSLFAIHGLDGFLAIFFLSLFILYQHKENISRLIDGTETKINFGTKTKNDVIVEKKPVKSTKKLTAVEPKKTTRKPTTGKKTTKAKKTTSKKKETK